MRGKLLGSIKALYKESKACVRVDGEATEEFMVEQGLRQRCPLSPRLFNVFLDRVAKEAMVGFQGGVELDRFLIQIFMFADDTVMLAQTAEDLNQNVGRLHEAVKRHGLTINWGKTNTMVFSREPTECKVEVGDVQLEQARETAYLGVRLSKNGRMESELERKISRAAAVVGSLKKRSSGIRSEAKMTVYNAVVVPILVYGCETWVLKDRDKTRFQAAEKKVRSSVVGVTNLECAVRNEAIRGRLKQEAVVAQVRRRRQMWRERMIEKEGSLVKRVRNGQGAGKRPRGRPRKRWRDEF